MDKKSARKTGLSRRKNLSEEDRKKENSVLFQKMAETAKNFTVIGVYVSVKDEADTICFIRWCFAQGKTVCVPRMSGHTLTFHCITDLSDLHTAAFGILEPDDQNRIEPDHIEIMFVPLSAFDNEGNRTGYGKGFYDSILQTSARKYGIAYSCQRVDHIEADPWDVKLDAVLIGDAVKE